MRRADRFLAAEADEIIFIMVREAEDLVRHDMADVDDQVPRLFDQRAVEINGDFPVGFAARRFFYFFGGNGPDMDDAVAPIVGMDALVRDRSEHPFIFRLGVGNVLTEGGDHMRIARFRQEIIKRLGDPAGAAVGAGQVGRQKQDAAKVFRDARPGFVEEALACLFDLGAGDRFSLKIKPWHRNSFAYVSHREERHGKSFCLS